MTQFVETYLPGSGSQLWFLTVTLVVLAAYGLIRLRLKRHEAKLQKHLENLENTTTLDTESPIEDQEEYFREHGIESVHTRFRAVRRVLYPILVVIWGFLACMPMLDKVPAAVMSFLLGTITVVVGIAGRPFIENVIAGVVIAFSQPLRIGDTVLIDDNWGKVEDISLTYSIIRIWDWRRYIIPNSQLLQKDFINYSITDSYQWAYVEFWVAYEADLELVEKLACEAVMASNAFVDYEPPSFWVMEMGKDGIRCWVAGWADTPADAWTVTHHVRTKLSMALHARGITCHSFHHRVHNHAPEQVQGPKPVLSAAR